MSVPSFNLDAYLARIGHHGPCLSTLETLTAIHERHARAIPFENLDILLDRSIPLDLVAIEAKLVEGRRGGYCFEQNILLTAALRALGFVVTPLMARVRWLVPPGMPTPRTHMTLRVEVDGRPWLADAGFGGIGLVTPIPFDSTDEQDTGHEPRRLVPNGRGLLQQVRLGEAWTDVYSLDLDEAFPIDFEVANWFTSTHPDSRFRQNLMVAMVVGDRRVSLLNREFTVRSRDGSVEKRTLQSPDELLAVLAEHFDLVFPAGTRFTCPNLAWI